MGEVLARLAPSDRPVRPIHLAFFEDQENQVSIVRARRYFPGKSGRSQEVYVVQMGSEWINGGSDEEIRAVFAHEIGHAVLGHLTEIWDPLLPCKDTPFWRTHHVVFTVWWAHLVAFSVSGQFVEGMWVWGLLALIMFHTTVMISYTIVHGHGFFFERLESRLQEYDADAFAARYACPKALIADLRKDERTFWQRCLKPLRNLTSTHPCVESRALALGVVPESAPSGVFGLRPQPSMC